MVGLAILISVLFTWVLGWSIVHQFNKWTTAHDLKHQDILDRLNELEDMEDYIVGVLVVLELSDEEQDDKLAALGKRVNQHDAYEIERLLVLLEQQRQAQKLQQQVKDLREAFELHYTQETGRNNA